MAHKGSLSLFCSMVFLRLKDKKIGLSLKNGHAGKSGFGSEMSALADLQFHVGLTLCGLMQ